jgi:hypothetical protein
MRVLPVPRVYSGTSHELAFAFGGTHEVGQLRDSNINQFAKDVGVSPKLVNLELQRTLTSLKNQARESLEEFQQTHGRLQLLDEVVKGINQRIRRLEHNVKMSR